MEGGTSLRGFCPVWPEARAGPASVYPDIPGAASAKKKLVSIAPLPGSEMCCVNLLLWGV